MTNLYSVTQIFEDGSYETVRKNVHATEAVKAFKHYTTSVAARMGVVKSVIITDLMDSVNMEWIYGKGIVFGLPDQKMPEVEG